MAHMQKELIKNKALISVRDLTLAYNSYIVLKDLSFTIDRGDVFIIMGGNGCGKSTLLKFMIGLKPSVKGEVFYDDINFWNADPHTRNRILKRVGILYQRNALWSSMTLAENVALPLEEYTDLGAKQISEIVSLKLSLVGLTGFEDLFPSELSGGMQKRAALARAMALDPEILFFDEPSAGLDPINARLLDDLILELSDSLKTTVVVITHDLASIFAIGQKSIFLDHETKTILAFGNPKDLLENSQAPKVRTFLTRGQPEPGKSTFAACFSDYLSEERKRIRRDDQQTK
jgi:phospholipid/cholesterol/gamma-HCH transport system ATP-binding protein